MSSSRVIYEDDEVVVLRALSEPEVEELVRCTIARFGRPVPWRVLRVELGGVVGEERLRRALVRLILRDEVVEMIDGSFGLRGMEVGYVPSLVWKRFRPLVRSKYYARWGHLIESFGGIRAAILYLRRRSSSSSS
ncbi:MAG: hypothetical protein QW230_03745 [Thermofilum sp.]